MQNLDEQLPLLYMLNYTLNPMTDVLESVCCWAKQAVVFGCQREYSRPLAICLQARRKLSNQAWVCFRFCESIDKSFFTDCSATLAVMIIDRTVYLELIFPIVPCGASLGLSSSVAPNRNAHKQVGACTHTTFFFLPFLSLKV